MALDDLPQLPSASWTSDPLRVAEALKNDAAIATAAIMIEDVLGATHGDVPEVTVGGLGARSAWKPVCSAGSQGVIGPAALAGCLPSNGTSGMVSLLTGVVVMGGGRTARSPDRCGWACRSVTSLVRR